VPPNRQSSIVNRQCAWLVFALFVCATGAAAQTPDPFIGVWKLNPDKSIYELGQPPQSFTRTYEDRGGGVILLTVEGFNAQGLVSKVQLVYKRDGREYPEASTGARALRHVRVRAIDRLTEELSFTLDGRPLETLNTITVSKDGRTLTQRVTGVTAQGQRYTNTVIYDREDKQ
jgi:hypothetical protein